MLFVTLLLLCIADLSVYLCRNMIAPPWIHLSWKENYAQHTCSFVKQKKLDNMSKTSRNSVNDGWSNKQRLDVQTSQIAFLACYTFYSFLEIALKSFWKDNIKPHEEMSLSLSAKFGKLTTPPWHMHSLRLSRSYLSSSHLAANCLVWHCFHRRPFHLSRCAKKQKTPRRLCRDWISARNTAS